MNILGDNKTSFILTKVPKSQNQIKHFNIIYHHIRKQIEDKKLLVV